MTVTDIRPAEFPWFRYDGYTFSLGLTDGERAWLSGHSASRYDAEHGRMVVTGGMGEQAEVAYAKIGTILEAAGLGWRDVTRLVENVTVDGIDAYAEAEEVRRRVLGDADPTVVTVVVERLLRPKALVEIEVSGQRGGGEPDGTVALPTILPLDERGEVVAPGDLRGQYRFCLERVAALLEAVGLDLSHVVKTVDVTTPATRAEHGRTSQPRRELLGPVFPAAAGLLMSRLRHPDALVALDVLASRHRPEAISAGWPHDDALTSSPAVRAGRTLHLSGFAALDPETREPVHPGDVVAQARFAYERILHVLGRAGAGPEHLVKTIEYVCPGGLAAYRGVAGVRRELLRSPWPASTGAVCAGLLRPELLIEVDPTAVLPA